MLVDIECHLSNNLPNIIIVGFANKSVGEARERLRGAFASCKLALPRKRILINLAPADIPKADSGFDLAIAVSIIQASAPQAFKVPVAAYVGELGLDGQIRAVRGIIGKLLVGRNLGITTFYIPAANISQAQLIPGLRLYPVDNLGQLCQHLAGLHYIEPILTSEGDTPLNTMSHNVEDYNGAQLSEVVGQELAKRALEIAAAGGHNILLSGPPGTGKSMLAKALPSIMPALSREEILAVTHLHSLASYQYDQIVTERPIRAPHHSASYIAIIGGGSSLKPGEISLAHRGILLFDEFPEFSQQTLESLRQPLEDRTIRLARAHESAEYPANFILVATANPCPCGYYGYPAIGTCTCLPQHISRYKHKLSGPILDRIDLQANVHEVNHAKLMSQSADPAQDAAVRARVLSARSAQELRHPSILNADLSNSQLKRHAKLGVGAKTLLDTAASKLNMSARGYMRTIKVARTIADLDNSVSVSPAHISEAIAYRPQKLV